MSRCNAALLCKHRERVLSRGSQRAALGSPFLMTEAVSGKPQSRHCPLTQDLPYRCTCCKCLSPFSLAGLLSDPLLLPDCSFSFSSAVAYANVSCQRLKHKKSACAVAAGPRKTTLHLTSGGGAFMSTSGAGGATLNDPHCCPSRQTTHLLLFHRKINRVFSPYSLLMYTSFFRQQFLANTLKILPKGFQSTQNQKTTLTWAEIVRWKVFPVDVSLETLLCGVQ